MGTSNPRYSCSSPTCNAKITRNQLRGSNGICIYCKTPMKHTSWMGGQQATLGQLLTIPKSEEAELKTLAETVGLETKDLISAAIVLKLKEWLAAENVEKAVKQDLMLEKLSRS